LVHDAYELAVAQGAVATALRGVATALLHDGSDQQREWARETLAVLDGTNIPPGNWMSAQLAHANAVFGGAHSGVRD
jgi:hypothetical protein